MEAMRWMRAVRGLTLLAALVGLAALTACGGGGGSASKGGGKSAPVTITFWQFWDSGVIRPILDKFEAENPDIKVVMEQQTWQNGREKILASVAAGTAPDLCELGSTWFAQFAANGALADVTALADSLKPQLRLWSAATYEGRLYGVPWVMGTRALFYNRELFRQAGLNGEFAPATWSELLAAARKIHNPKAGIYGFGRNGGERYILFKKFMPFAWSNGGDVLAPDGKSSVFDSPANVAALQYYLSLGDCALTEKQDVLDQSFKQGKVGILLSGAWLFKTLPTDAPNLQYGVGVVPAPDDRPDQHRSFGGGELLVIFQNSKHTDAAFRLARYLARADNALLLSRAAKSVQPAAVGLENDPYFQANPGEQAFMKQLDTAVFPPNVAAWSDVEGAVESWVEKALYGKVTAAEAVAGAHAEINQLLSPK